MRTRSLIFIFVITTSFYLLFKHRKDLVSIASDLNTAKASHNCKNWLPLHLWVFLNSDKIPFMSSREDDFYAFTDYEKEAMLSKAGQVDAIKWFHNEHLYNLTPKSFSYTTIEKKYDRDDMPLMLRLQATPPYGHWEFFKTSTGLWVAKIKVRVDNPLYSKNITCPEGQKCTWEVEQSREKTPLELNPELIKILIEEGLLSSKEYELLEGFCKYIEQRHTQEKLHELQSTFENKCSLKFQTLSPEDQQGLCVRIRNNFIPAFKNLEALTSVTE